MRRRRIALRVGIGVAVAAALVLVAVLIVTQTDWGRERVRRVALDRIQNMIDGEVEIGRVEGNLLRRVRLIDVAIRDDQGRPFLEADTIETRFGLRALLGQRIELTDLRVVRAVVLLDKPPGEEWNYARIFETDGDPEEPRRSRWGDWVSLEDVTLVDTRVLVRTEWHPPSDLTPAEREAAIRRALAGETREHVVEVPGGYQNVMDFRKLDAELPHVLLAHPDSTGIDFDVASLSGLVRPFSPPPARVRDFAGGFRLVRDSLFMSGVRAELADSRLAGGGVYALETGDLLLIARGDPVAFADLRWLYPPLPRQGGGSMTMTLELGTVVNRILLQDMDVAVGDATLAGRLDLTTGDTLRIGDTDLRFARVQTGLVERLVDVDFPRSGELTGRLALEGQPRALQLNGDVRFDDAAGGSSRVIARGGLGVEPDIAFRELRLRFEPLQADLARIVLPDFPLRGTIEGTALLSGSPASLDLEADLALRDPRHGLSRVRLAGGIDSRGDLRLRDLDVRMDPLRLDLFRDELPELPAGAAATGRVALDGFPSRMFHVDGEIALSDPATGVSHIAATGELAFGEERGFDDLQVRGMVLRLDPLRLDLVRDQLPELPAGATASGRVALDGRPASALRVDGEVVVDDPATGISEIAATGGVRFGAVPAFDDLLVQMTPLRADLLQPWVPDFPRGGSVTGSLRLDGTPTGFLHVDGDLAHHHARLGESRVEASGGIDLAGPIEFRALDLRLEPLHMALVHAFAPDIPLDGTLTGTATLDGTPATALAVTGDVVHEEGAERSHVMGRADIAPGPGGWAAVDVRLQPLSLDVAGRFLPAAGLRGTVSGRLVARGDMEDVRLDADLRTGDGGTLRAEGTLDLAGIEPVYDLDLRLGDFDLAAVTWRAPAETDLTGSVTARGRGLEPATMRSTIVADLVDSEIDDVGADLVRLRLGIDAGLARVDSSIIRVGAAEALLDGTFGLVAGRDGVLGYEVVVDSLHAFAPWLPGADSGVAQPVASPPIDIPAPAPAPDIRIARSTLPAPPPPSDREPGEARETSPAPPAAPTLLAEEVSASGDARYRRYVAADGARVSETTTLVRTGIERSAASRRQAMLAAALNDPLRTAPGDTVPGTASDTTAAGVSDTLPDATPIRPLDIPADSLAGSLYAAGTLRGNVTRFDMDGRATANELVYRGAYVGDGEAEYALADVGTASIDIRLDAELQELRTSTMAFDSLSVEGRYRGLRGEGTGEALVVAYGADETEYRADAEFTFSPARNELRIADLLLRHDTATWRMARPGVVSWRDDAIQVADIELLGDAGGRVRLDGRLPVDGSGDLDVVVEDLRVAQLVALLQLDRDATGRLDLEANVRGTLADPRITGTARLDEATLDGGAVPDLVASFRYQGQELNADATLTHEGRQLATAEARVPIDLSLMPDIAPRLLPGELAIDVVADSLPIEAIPALPDQLDQALGRLRGDFSVRGTVADPVITGDLDLALASVRLVPLGIQLDDVAGSLVLDGGVMRVDSLVGYSGGPIRISGEIGIANPIDPTFALEVESRETLVIDTEDITMAVDADLTVRGSLAAMEVEGDVRTRRGVIHIPELTEMGETDVVSLHAPTRSQRIESWFLRELTVAAAEQPLLDRMRLDVTLQIDRDVWLRSTEANVEIYTPRDVGPLRIRLDGAGTGLALEGTLSTDRGEYEFMSRRFELTRGAATFVGGPGIDPVLQIAAEHEVRLPGREAFDVRVIIGGTLREMEITLESNAQPPIAQTDLLAYLAFGRNASSLLYRQGSPLSAQGGDAGELVGNAAGLATQQLGTIALDAILGDVEEELMSDLHVDVFRITPADLPPDIFSGSYGDLLRSTEVEAGRYFTSRLFIAGQINTGVSRPGVLVEYVGPFGVQWLTTWRSRWVPTEPTLTEQAPQRTGVLGSFLVREWRY